METKDGVEVASRFKIGEAVVYDQTSFAVTTQRPAMVIGFRKTRVVIQLEDGDTRNVREYKLRSAQP